MAAGGSYGGEGTVNRRSFLTAGVATAAAALPATLALAAPKQSEYFRLSVEKDDPGFIPYGKLMGDGHWPTVYLDGVKADLVVTCDAREGWIKRYIETDLGNVARVPGHTIPTEIVHGKVVIEIDRSA